MNKRGVALLLILSCTIALGALVWDYRFDGMVATERAAGRSLDLEFRTLGDALTTLEGAQRSYVATGQSAADWVTRATALANDADLAIARRKTAARGDEAAGIYEDAAEGLARFRKMDAQARVAIDQGDRLHASDLIFNESAGILQRVRESLAAAQARDAAAIDGNITQLTRLRAIINGVAALFVLAVALYFGRSAMRAGARGPVTTAQMLRDLPPPVKAGVAAPAVAPIAAAHVPAPAIAATAPVPAAAPVAAVRPTNLSAAAELCVDLARVLDAADVPALLERAATVLDARGIMLWAIDSDGARLHPSLCHGYSDKVLRKLRPLQVDADNVTSLSYRSLQPQVLNGASPNESAAMAIPLMSGTGCVGVLAAELRHNRPHADLIPVARIIGAQFSTLIAPPEDAGRRTAQG